MDKDKETKVFNDPIHGNIELHPLCVMIIDTPQFQRLRFVKQLGGAYFVYPGAAHNRFEHSIGTCHLAGKMVRALQSREPEDIEKDEKISPTDVLCVEIAGLCHDLGHGPFSHVFDRSIIPALIRKTELEGTAEKDRKKWKHENASVDMLDYIIKKNGDLRDEFKTNHIGEEDFKFIKEMIIGPDKGATDNVRLKKRGFLYEIVSNGRNGIDVDKWDYFARDCHMLGIGNNFNHNRCIDFSRVIEVGGERQICFRDKEATNLYDMFHTRYLLHKRAYQHKTNNIIEIMLTEALVEANDFIKLPGNNGQLRTMLEAIDDMEAYSVLTDDVILQILRSTDENLAASKRLIQNILSRNLYVFVGQFFVCDDKKFKDESEVRTKIIKLCGDLEREIVIDLVDINYGSKDKNPIDEVNFYSKINTTEAKPIKAEEVSLLLPTRFAEQIVRIYCRNKEMKSEVAKVYEKLAAEYKEKTQKTQEQ